MKTRLVARPVASGLPGGLAENRFSGSREGIGMSIDRRAAMAAFVASTAAIAGRGERAIAASPPPGRQKPSQAGIEQWDMTSRFTGRTYRIYVAAPPSAAPKPPGGYPVVYVNDGDFEFHTAAEAMLMQSVSLEIKAAYIVGIGYGKGWEYASRARCADLTPTPPDPATLAAMQASPVTKGAPWGEASLYHRFMTEELRPRIEAAYPVDPKDAILWGHSFGGLFGVHVLFNHPEAYRTFSINSPSINLNDGAVLKDEPKLAVPVASGKVAPRILFTAGEYEEKLADYVKMRPGVTREQTQAMLTAFGMISHARALGERIKALRAPAPLDVQTIVFEGETHLSVIPAAMSRALRFALPI